MHPALQFPSAILLKVFFVSQREIINLTGFCIGFKNRTLSQIYRQAYVQGMEVRILMLNFRHSKSHMLTILQFSLRGLRNHLRIAINQYCFFLSPVTTRPQFLYQGIWSHSSRTRLRFSSHRGEFAAEPFDKDGVLPRHGGSILSGGTVTSKKCSYLCNCAISFNESWAKPVQRIIPPTLKFECQSCNI